MKLIMFNFLKKIIEFFSIYINPFEKKVDLFLKKLNPNTDRSYIHDKVLELMRENVVIFHLWLERRYKGYKYLKKGRRKKLYTNVKKLQSAFEEFCNKQKVDIAHITEQVNNVTSSFRGNNDELKYISCIMSFFSGHKGCFKYQESSNFGKLLKDPKHSQVIGDCNQIVTLYTYFFGLKYDISRLNIKVYPGHVCLHYQGVDVEATNGSFQHYQKKAQKILPITELIAVNLLDISDSNEKMYSIAPKALMESAKLTFLLSSDREIVSHNLKAAYQTVVNSAIKEGNYDTAFDYAKQSGNDDLKKSVAHNSAVYFLKQNQFSKAEKYAKYTKDEKLKKSIIESEGIYYYGKRDYKHAISIFQKTNDTKRIKNCYSAMFIDLNKEIASVKTIDQLKMKKHILQKMDDFAHKSHDPKLIKHISDLVGQIR